MIRNIAYFAILIAVCAAAPSPAALVDLNAVKDNTLYQSPTGALSNGQGEYIFTGRTNQSSNSLRRSLIAFDIDSQMPAGVTITNVTLSLWSSFTISGPQNIELHTVLKDWGESTSNANGQEGQGVAAANGDATWIHTFRPGTLWTTPGGDFSPAASAVTSVAEDGALYTWSSAQMVADVQNWLNSPTTDFGWEITGNEGVGATAKRFNSRENSDMTRRPVLTIEYTPEPATLALLTCALPFIRRRSRR
jgi:hypothetical protein